MNPLQMVHKNPLGEGPTLQLLLPLPLPTTDEGLQSSLALIFSEACYSGLVFPLQPAGLDLEVHHEVELLQLLATGLTDCLLTSWDPDFFRWLWDEEVGTRLVLGLL